MYYRGRILILTLFLILIFSTRVALGCWASVPLEKIVKGGHVVVVGEIVRIKEARPLHFVVYQFADLFKEMIAKIARRKEPRRAYDIAYIEVAEVLKNELRKPTIKVGDQIPLSMPSMKNSVRTSTDIRYKKGTAGVWILRYHDGTFWVTHPDNAQSLNQQKIITQIIHNQKQKSSAGG